MGIAKRQEQYSEEKKIRKKIGKIPARGYYGVK